MRLIHLDAVGNPKGNGQLDHVYTAKLSQTTDGTDTLTITCSDTIDKDDRIIFIDDEGTCHEHINSNSDETRAESTPYGTYTLPDSIQETAGSIPRDIDTNTGPQSIIEQALADTDWTAGRIENGNGSGELPDLTDADALTIIRETANAYGLELRTHVTLDADGTRVASRSVDLLSRPGDDTGREFRYGHDLVSIRRTIGSTHPITRLWVWGKTESGTNGRVGIASVNDGRGYIDAGPEALERWGRRGPDGGRLPYEGTVTFNDIEDPSKLLEEGKAYLKDASEPVIGYEGEVASMRAAGLDTGNVRLGDTVRITDTSFHPPLFLQGRITKLEHDLLGGVDTISIGAIGRPITDVAGQVESTIRDLWDRSDSWDDAANLTESYLDGVIDGLNQVMNTTGGYVYLHPGEGIVVYDRPEDQDPTMAIQIGGGYFRIANAKRSDGSWDWRTMGTGAGLVADIIITGMLRGGSSWWNLDTGEIHFDSGTISSANGNSWDLTNGNLTINDGVISISGWYNGRQLTTIIDSGGLRIMSGGTRIAGLMADDDGDTGMRTNMLGPDDSNYIKIGGGNALELYSGGRLIFSISGSTSQSSGLFRAGALGNEFLTVGNEPSGTPNSTVIRSATGDDYPRMCVSPTACYWMTGHDSTMIMSENGWATIYGACISTKGYMVYCQDGSVQLLSPSGKARVDLTDEYSAIVYDTYHVMVSEDGVNEVTKPAAASASANVIDAKLMTLADEGLDLDSPDAYDSTPVAIEELTNEQLHDIIRLLCDGDADGARARLDEYEDAQRTWTQKDCDLHSIPVNPPDLTVINQGDRS